MWYWNQRDTWTQISALRADYMNYFNGYTIYVGRAGRIGKNCRLYVLSLGAVAHALQNHVSILSRPKPIQRTNMFNSWPILLGNTAVGAPILRLPRGFRSARARTCDNWSSQDRCQGRVVRRFHGAGAWIHSRWFQKRNPLPMFSEVAKVILEQACMLWILRVIHSCQGVWGVPYFVEQTFMAAVTMRRWKRPCQGLSKERTVECNVERYRNQKWNRTNGTKIRFLSREHARPLYPYAHTVVQRSVEQIRRHSNVTITSNVYAAG